MTYIKLGSVHAFPRVAPDKAQALKPLEEAAEVFGAWQRIDRMSAAFNTVDEINSQMMCDMQNDLMDEIAGTIQACCNLAAALGVHDLTPYLARCEERNRKRGRYGEEEPK